VVGLISEKSVLHFLTFIENKIKNKSLFYLSLYNGK